MFDTKGWPYSLEPSVNNAVIMDMIQPPSNTGQLVVKKIHQIGRS